MRHKIKLVFSLLLLFSINIDCSNNTKKEPKASGTLDIEIIDKPIVFNELRDSLSLHYLKTRHEIEKDKPEIDPKIIVIHWTELSFDETFETFNPAVLPARPDIKKQSMLNVSAHFLVNREGRIFRLMPETKFARHIIGLNYCSIGIENVGGPSFTPMLTKKQLEANVKLVSYLKHKYPKLEYLIGHYQYQQFQGTPLWKEINPNYRTKKEDPGEAFMEALHKKTTPLKLKGKQ